MPIPIYLRTAAAISSALLLTGVCLGQTTTRVSVNSLGNEGNGASFSGYSPSISSDGRYVAFQSWARNLVAGDTNGASDIFVHDRHTGLTERVSVDSSGNEGSNSSSWPSISADGRFVAFQSDADNLVANDTNLLSDVFVHDRQTGMTERASVDSSGLEGNQASTFASISADGRFLAFHSRADNFVPGDTNGNDDIFVHDRQTGTTERVSVSSSGLQANDSSTAASISADGRYLCFSSFASNLVPGDTQGQLDVFVHDRQTGATERVSVSSSGVAGNDTSQSASISADGRSVAFESRADNLVFGVTNGSSSDIYVHDRQTGMTQRASVASSGGEGSQDSTGASISRDGRQVAFLSRVNNLVPADTNGDWDVFVHDCQTGVTERVSVNSRGAEGIRGSSSACISADGRHVVFESKSSNFVSADTNGERDVFVHDRWDGLGANSIYLAGPATASVGAPIEFSWQSTRGGSRYWLAYSKHTQGAVIGGHQFGIGNPLTVIATGLNATNGLGAFTTAPIPARAAGHTLYFEVAARDASGTLYDSNVHAVMFQ